jgi:hypothetical protein
LLAVALFILLDPSIFCFVSTCLLDGGGGRNGLATDQFYVSGILRVKYDHRHSSNAYSVVNGCQFYLIRPVHAMSKL